MEISYIYFVFDILWRLGWIWVIFIFSLYVLADLRTSIK